MARTLVVNMLRVIKSGVASNVNVSMVANPTDSVAAATSTLVTTENKSMAEEAPDATKGMKTPGQTAMKGLFNEETVQHEPKTPNQVS